jgi:hypothetical protein
MGQEIKTKHSKKPDPVTSIKEASNLFQGLSIWVHIKTIEIWVKLEIKWEKIYLTISNLIPSLEVKKVGNTMKEYLLKYPVKTN